MFRYIALCSMLVTVMAVTSSSKSGTSDYNLAVVSLQDKNGHWQSKITLNHDSTNFWDMYVYRKADDKMVAETITIVEKERVPVTITEDDREQLHLQRGESSFLCKGIHKSNYSVGDQFPAFTSIQPNSSYKVYNDEMNWNDAKNFCEKNGSHLLIINSESEAQAIGFSIMKKTCFWIGFHDQFEEGKYVTISNMTLQEAGFRKWWKNEPKGVSTENCGCYRYDSSTEYGLGDYMCSSKLPFICEN